MPETHSSPTTARRLDPEARRAQIIECAAKLFEERPYSDVSTTEIAAAAGVGRPLVNHYFGNKRELYLEVVRRFVFVPAIAVERIPKSASVFQRIEAVIDRWLDVAERHRGMRMSTVMSEDMTRDPELEQILREADDVAATRMMDAIGLEPEARHREAVRAVVVSYGGLAKSASRQWLDAGTLTRRQVRDLLVHTMSTIVRDVLPPIDQS